MRCPNCGTNNPAANRLCLKCSQSLPVEGAATPFSSSAAVTNVPQSQNLSISSTPQASSVPQTTPASPTSASVPTASASGVDYVPSGKMGPGAPAMIWAAALIGGVVVGAFYAWVAQYFSFVLVSQLVAGMLLGSCISLAVKATKCRNPKLAVTCAVVGGLLLYGTHLLVTSQMMRAEILNSLTGQPAMQAAASQKLTPITSLVWYLEDLSESGVKLSSTHGSSSAGGIQIKGVWYWVLLLVEIGIATFTAVAVASGAASARFCEGCDAWWVSSRFLRVHPDRSGAMLLNAQNGDFMGLKAVPQTNEKGKKPDDKNYCTATLERCPKCSDGTITIATVVKGAAKPAFRTRVDSQTAANLAAKT